MSQATSEDKATQTEGNVIDRESYERILQQLRETQSILENRRKELSTEHEEQYKSLKSACQTWRQDTTITGFRAIFWWNWRPPFFKKELDPIITAFNQNPNDEKRLHTLYAVLTRAKNLTFSSIRTLQLDHLTQILTRFFRTQEQEKAFAPTEILVSSPMGPTPTLPDPLRNRSQSLGSRSVQSTGSQRSKPSLGSRDSAFRTFKPLRADELLPPASHSSTPSSDLSTPRV